jgi:pimeloyl-ACP methyl ester carboxylesterase
VNDPKLVTQAEPLVVTVPRPLAAGEYVLPVGLDGEFYLPLGWAESQGGSTRIVLERLPQPDAEGTRTIGGALRIFFQKVNARLFGTKYPYPILAVATPGDGDEVEYDGDPDSVRAKVAKATRIALFVHGIIGDTRVMAGSLNRAGIADRYDLLLTFDYENLNDPITETAKGLKQRLEAAGIVPGAGKQLDVIAHSMGGLVSRWYVEQLGGNKVVRRLVMLGTPNGGSPWPGVVDWATTALAVGLNALSKYAWPAAVVAGLVRASKRVQVALDEMNPDSTFIKNLYAGADPKVPYALIAGDTSLIPAPQEQEQRSRLQRLLARLWSDRTKYDLADLFFDGPNNDIAVMVNSVRHVAAGRDPACDIRKALPCDHVSYFHNADALRELAAVLGRP